MQEELEQQRMHWTCEIDKLLSPMAADVSNGFSFGHQPDAATSRRATPVFNAEKNSYVDTAKPLPVFKAFVDVSEYPSNSVSVSLDQLRNKVVVEACDDDSNVALTFTQKIPLPRYADLTKMTAQVNRKGLVKIELPLLYYFPQDYPNLPQHHSSNHHSSNHHSSNHHSSNHHHHQEETYGKSYVSEVKTDSRGVKVMEIVVKPGWKMGVDEVVVEVVDEKFLVVSMDTEEGRKVVKTYALPETADPSSISSRVHGALVLVCVPV